MQKVLPIFLLLLTATPALAEQAQQNALIQGRYGDLIRWWAFLQQLEVIGDRCLPSKDAEFKVALKGAATHIEGYLHDHSPSSLAQMEALKPELAKSLPVGNQELCRTNDSTSGLEQYLTIHAFGADGLDHEVEKYIREAEEQN